MPFAGYKDFDDCVRKVMAKKGWPKERAQRYCASIKRRVEGTESEIDVNKKLGDIPIKPGSDSGWEDV